MDPTTSIAVHSHVAISLKGTSEKRSVKKGLMIDYQNSYPDCFCPDIVQPAADIYYYYGPFSGCLLEHPPLLVCKVI